MLCLIKPVKRDRSYADHVLSGLRCKFSLFCFSQNSIMDIRGFFTGSKKEKGEDDSSKKKRPAEEGVNLTPPPAAKAEIPAIVEIRLSMGCSPRWSDVLHVV